MKNCSCLILTIIIVFSNVSVSFAQGDLMNEVGIQPVPEGMSFEEYRDANRRLTTGVIVSSLLPIPGMMHFYADERKTGYVLLGSSIVGLLSMFGGLASMSSEGDDWKESDFETIDIDGNRYEKIPVLIYEEDNVTNTAYSLRKLKKEHDASASGVVLIALGGGIIIASHLYDWIHGIRTIEDKRDRVRYEYGKQLNFSLEPMLLPEKDTVGISLGVKF